jgi:hypothetical protein
MRLQLLLVLVLVLMIINTVHYLILLGCLNEET